MEAVAALSQLIPFCCAHLHGGLNLPSLRCSQTAQTTVVARSLNASIICNSSNGATSNLTWNLHQRRRDFVSLFCYDKDNAERINEEHVGVFFAKKLIGTKPCCTQCQARGAVLCTTCSGSGLYVDSILESQGVIVKVRCLGCGGTGNILCVECGGRGHL